MKEKVT